MNPAAERKSTMRSFLASDESSFVTSAELAVAGGAGQASVSSKTKLSPCNGPEPASKPPGEALCLAVHDRLARQLA